MRFAFLIYYSCIVQIAEKLMSTWRFVKNNNFITYLIGRNFVAGKFRRLKIFVGKNFCHLPIISSLFADEISTNKVIQDFVIIHLYYTFLVTRFIIWIFFVYVYLLSCTLYFYFLSVACDHNVWCCWTHWNVKKMFKY